MNSHYIKPFIFVVIIQLFFCALLSAQQKLNTTISGKVFDKSTNGPLEYATITLISKQSGNVITGTVADVKGAFAISNIPLDTYMLNIEFIGYEKTTLDNVSLTSSKHSVALGTVFLSPSMQSLQSVTIVGDKPIVENKID